MEDNTAKNYFSKIALMCVVVIGFFSFSMQAHAQIMTYGGKQLMFWGSEICNSSQTNVHFILSGNGITSLYADPGIKEDGDSDVEIGVDQVGTYLEAPVPCIVSGSPPIVIWVPDGTYIEASTSQTMRQQFFAGAVDPFIKKINMNA